MPFDPGAAAQAYLASLPAAARLRAVHYTEGGHLLLFAAWAAGVLAAVVIARSGLLSAVQRRLQRRRKRPITTSFVIALVFALADDLLELPFTVYAQWWRERSYDLTRQPFTGWLGEAVLGFLISALLSGVFLTLLYLLIRRAPRLWWALAGALASAAVCLLLVVAPIAIEPLFNKYTPAPPGPTRNAVIALARAAHVPSDKIFIYNGSKQSTRYTANVSGLFGSARVAMSDVMFQKGADIGEVRAVVGHEMGHYAHLHALVTALSLGLLSLAGFAIAALAFPAVDRLVGTGARSIADPLGLPTLIVTLSTLGLLATPLANSLTRFEEADADAFSLRIAEEPDGLSRALVKTIEYRADSPSPVEEVLFYDHPSVRRRIERAMAWKASHLAETRAQEAADAAEGRP